MSDEQISAFARMNAERLMRGGKISDSEMCVIIAGLMLSVDKLANSFDELKQQLWSEEKMRKMISDEVDKHCKASIGGCQEKVESSSKSASWIGRMLRSFAGMRCWLAGMFLLVSVCNSGCSTYEVRFKNDGVIYPKPYPATQSDVGTLLYMSSEFGFCGTILATPLIVDIPFSLVSDTACLPYDLITMK